MGAADIRKEVKDNLHEQPIEFYTAKYREADPAEIADRIGIPYDGSRFTVCFMGREIKVSHPDFAVFPEIADNSARVLILRYLLYARITPYTGEYISFRDMPSGDLYIQPFTGRCIRRLLGKYGRKPEVFRQVLEAMGAEKISYADACYDVELFPGLKVRFILWEGDEEFPASAQILFSENFRNAFETYDLAEIGGVCINAFGAKEKEL